MRTTTTARLNRIITCYCWADGTIKFTRRLKVPKGALSIVTGPERRVRQAVQRTARLGHDGRTLIIAGVRDIHTGFVAGDKVQALKDYQAWVRRQLSKLQVTHSA